MPFAIPSPIAGQVPVTVTPAHEVFEYLVVAEAGLGGYVHGHAQHSGVLLPPTPVRHVCLVEQAEIECDVPPILAALVNQTWPTSISFSAEAMAEPVTGGRSLTPTGVQRVMGIGHAYAFLSYYENVKDRICSHHGFDPRKPTTWASEVFKFAWMTRNAMGHGGTLEIRDPAASATWRGLTLTRANDGEQMLFNHISGGDLVLLMLDVEDLI
jgi:hypothetical protein